MSDPQAIRWDHFLIRCAERRDRALHAAAALGEGERGPAATLLAPWRFTARPGLLEALCARVAESPPPCEGAEGLALFGPHPDPSGVTLRTEAAHRGWLSDRGRSTARPLEPVERRAVALDHLAFWGEELQRRERASWRAVTYKVDPIGDAVAAGLWRRWFEGRFWEDQEDWDRLLRPVVTRTIAAVVLDRGVPRHRQAPLVRELRESLFMRLVGQDLLRRPPAQRLAAEQLDGFLELAVRALETAEPGPVDAVAAAAPPELWTWAAACPRARRGFAEALETFGGAGLPEAHAQAERFRREALDDLALIEVILDLQVAQRLLRGLEEGGDPWSIVSNNRGKARGRLRALMAQADPAQLQAPLLALDALAARTSAAARRYAWAWARELLRHDLSVDALGGVTPPCEAPGQVLAPLDAEEREILATWVRLVALKGRLPQLLRWATEGGGGRDTTWGRLLSHALPATLRDPALPGDKQARYSRVRAELALELDGWLAPLRPTLAAVAAEPPGRDLGARVSARLQEGWHPAVALPSRGFPAMRRNAAEALDHLQGGTP